MLNYSKELVDKLSLIYNSILREGDYEKSVEQLNQLKVNSLVSYLVNKYDVENNNEDVNKIVELLVKILQEIYNNGGNILSPVPDEEYDKLYELHLQINESDVVGASISSVKDRIISSHKYTDLRGTLDKIHFIKNEEKGKDKRKSLEDWIKGIENKIGRPLYEKEREIFMFPKWDGLSVVFECDGEGRVIKALTRGDTTKNEAVELTIFRGFNMNYLNDFKEGEFGVKTEVVMTLESFNKLKEKYPEFKNPRSAVSSILNSKDYDKKFLKYLTIIPLQIQNYNSKEIRIPNETFNNFPYKVCDLLNFKEVKRCIDEIKNEVDKNFSIIIDGIVIRLKNKKIQKILGRQDNINKYEVAYKLPPEQKKTILKDVEFSVGVLGSITPVAKVEPVKIKGNTISSISLGSVERFELLDLNKGDEVIVKYDVIPYLDKDETCKKGEGDKILTPTTCPYCGQKLIKEPVLKCVNIECESRMIGKLMNYVTKMSIPNISIGIITNLYKEGVLKSIEDLYRLEKHKKRVLLLEGFGEKLFNKIVDGINSRKEVFDYQLLGAIGIPDIGEKMFKKILTVYNIEELIKISENGEKGKLTTIEGIKDKTAEKIILGIIMNTNLIEFLLKELKVKRDDRKYSIKVAFTKVRDKEFEKYLDSKGVLVMDSYNKNVDLLIVKDRYTDSSKVTKARKDGKEIITIGEAYKIFGYEK